MYYALSTKDKQELFETTDVNFVPAEEDPKKDKPYWQRLLVRLTTKDGDKNYDYDVMSFESNNGKDCAIFTHLEILRTEVSASPAIMLAIMEAVADRLIEVAEEKNSSLATVYTEDKEMLGVLAERRFRIADKPSDRTPSVCTRFMNE